MPKVESVLLLTIFTASSFPAPFPSSFFCLSRTFRGVVDLKRKGLGFRRLEEASVGWSLLTMSDGEDTEGPMRLGGELTGKGFIGEDWK